ncbi:MAG TPA: stage II sporulation protein M [Acidimicrobiales bacterium]|nr:stage II sporulation protein M [Acidimicrobiales bacterium]
MDVDRFIVQNQAAWQRLEELTRLARTRPTPEQVDELVQLYQRTSAHLSHARSERADPVLVARLTRLVAGAAGVIYGTRSRSAAGFARFFTTSFPAAVWHARRFVLVAALLLLVPAFTVGTWIATSDEALDASGPDAVREAYVEDDFEAYYSSAPAGQFATEVTVNNIQVSILAFAAGALLCVVTAWILVSNGAGVGVAGGLFAAVGQQPKFWGLILPHGILELSAVIVAGGAGLAIGWAIVAPGDRPRSVALAEEGRRSAAIVLGLVLAFVVAGTIEGFVTPSSLPTAARVAVGVAAGAAFWTYVITLGRRAAALGYTGAIGEHERLTRATALSPPGQVLMR